MKNGKKQRETVTGPVAVCVIGLGYIGLPTAAVLARTGLQVTGVDVSDQHVNAVNRGDLPFVEEGLEEVVKDVVGSGTLHASKEVPEAEVYVVAVPTPFLGAGHQADLSHIEAAARSLAPRLSGGELVILESTVPPGATEHTARLVLAQRPDLSLDGTGGRPVVHFAHCPERVLPGRILTELVTNDRVIGGITDEAARRARDLYATFCQGQILLTDARTAEMVKLAENSFRDVNIAFANELSVVCEKLDIDVWELISLANRHPRVNILRPGPGVGGHCIAVDPWFIVSMQPEQARLIRTAREVNDAKPGYVIDQVRTALDGKKEPVLATLGLTFKADVDDLRESPALSITHDLAVLLPTVDLLVVEPHVEQLPPSLAGRPNVELVGLSSALERADVVLLLVDHREFRSINRGALDGRDVIDTRGLWH